MTKYQILVALQVVGLLAVLLSESNTVARLMAARSDSAAVELCLSAKNPTDADFAAHVERLKKRLPSGDFTIVVQPPFVVIGDEPAEAVKAHSERTVKWAVDKLKQDYFSKDPNDILDIWLFKDAPSYEQNAVALFGDKPTTPYGYYSSRHKALIMNISTGGGTLVHEIVHPFIEANFPNCPPWLNEGLGSLYEQSGEVDGHIHGYPNWRLPGLQQAIKAEVLPGTQGDVDIAERGPARTGHGADVPGDGGGLNASGINRAIGRTSASPTIRFPSALRCIPS
jgi:hypothetical protein